MKWVEVKPLASITMRQVEGFVWMKIITRFGIPKAIITNNGTQFNNAKFRKCYENYGTQLRFSSVAHPQTNGLAEVTNQTLLEGLKRRVVGAYGTWVDELPSILWASCRTLKIVMRESLLALPSGPRWCSFLK